MKCFVTGATGFVGGHLCERLMAEGHEVIALARETSDRSLLESLGCRIAAGGIDSMNVFAHYAREIDVLFHLAAVTHPLRSPDFRRVNQRGTEHLISGLRRGDFSGKFVLLSSLAAAGPSRNMNHFRKESETDAPVSLYGRSKLGGELRLKKQLPEGCAWTILRPGSIYGPREHKIRDVIQMINRNGLAVQFGDGVNIQLTHVQDVVEGLMMAAFNPQTSGKTYFINDRQVWSFEQIARLAGEALARPVRVIKAPLAVGKTLAWTLDHTAIWTGRQLAPLGRDKMREMAAGYWIADPSAIEEDLEWRPKWTFPEGLSNMVEWCREEGYL